MGKIIQGNAIEQQKKELGLKFSPGLPSIGLRTGSQKVSLYSKFLLNL